MGSTKQSHHMIWEKNDLEFINDIILILRKSNYHPEDNLHIQDFFSNSLQYVTSPTVILKLNKSIRNSCIKWCGIRLHFTEWLTLTTKWSWICYHTYCVFISRCRRICYHQTKWVLLYYAFEDHHPQCIYFLKLIIHHCTGGLTSWGTWSGSENKDTVREIFWKKSSLYMSLLYHYNNHNTFS